MTRPDSGIAPARMFRWQLAPVTQDFLHQLEQEPLSRKHGGKLYPPGSNNGTLGNWHRGVDIALAVGTPIRLILSGILTVLPYDARGFGHAVQSDGARYRVVYGHLSVVRVMNGERGVHGDLIALSGSSGNSTGPHIHFEVWDKEEGAWIDPWLVV